MPHRERRTGRRVSDAPRLREIAGVNQGYAPGFRWFAVEPTFRMNSLRSATTSGADMLDMLAFVVFAVALGIPLLVAVIWGRIEKV